MNRRPSKPVLFALAAGVAVLACGRRPDNPETPAGRPREAVAAAAAPHDDHGAVAGERREAKVSDLDQPVEALLARSCEHGRKTFECDACRYEVGVVRVPAKLVEGGPITRASAVRRRVEAPISLDGEVRFDERRVAHVSPRIEGTIRKVHVSLGEPVRRGQPLVELESVQLGEAEGDFQSTQASLRLAQANAARQERLREERISSEKEYLVARQELEVAQIRARAVEDKLARLGVDRDELGRLAGAGRSARGGGLVIRAPADGLVLEMHAVPGELVKPDEGIVTVGDVSSVWVWANLHEDRLARVLDAQRGERLRAEVGVKAFPDAVFAGTVAFVGPAMDERTRTVKVRISVENPGDRLRAGMFAAVRIFLPGAEEVLAVPAAAVLSDEGRAFVFVHHHGDYWIRRPVETGGHRDGWVEVKSGLVGGEVLAADGAFLLKSDVLRSKMGAGCAD